MITGWLSLPNGELTSTSCNPGNPSPDVTQRLNDRTVAYAAETPRRGPNNGEDDATK